MAFGYPLYIGGREVTQPLMITHGPTNYVATPVLDGLGKIRLRFGKKKGGGLFRKAAAALLTGGASLAVPKSKKGRKIAAAVLTGGASLAVPKKLTRKLTTAKSLKKAALVAALVDPVSALTTATLVAGAPGVAPAAAVHLATSKKARAKVKGFLPKLKINLKGKVQVKTAKPSSIAQLPATPSAKQAKKIVMSSKARQVRSTGKPFQPVIPTPVPLTLEEVSPTGPSTAKVALVAGIALLAAGGGAYLLLRRRKSPKPPLGSAPKMTPNRRRSRRRRRCRYC